MRKNINYSNKKKWIRLLIIFLGIISNHFATAQSVTGADTIISELNNIRLFYSKHAVSFDVEYTYSNEHTPDIILDSIKGKMELSGDNYRSLLDSTETIRNEKYNIILFKEDKIMYLSKGVVAGATGNPLQTMKTMLDSSGINKYSITRGKKEKVISFDFPSDGPCRKMEITIDLVSGYLSAMSYLIKTKLLIESPEEASEDTTSQYEEYALVRCRFFNYNETGVDSNRFDEHTFFNREGSVFNVTETYNDYKIFVGSPNL